MSARGDYQHLAHLETARNDGNEIEQALDEIDLLRATVARLEPYVRAWRVAADEAERMEREIVAETGPAHHQPRRGDEVEAWIKQWREQWRDGEGNRIHREWDALDKMLDDYRLHADTGTAIYRQVRMGDFRDDLKRRVRERIETEHGDG